MNAHIEDLSLTRNLAFESASRATFMKSMTWRNILFGTSALALATGCGIAVIIWANNQKVDPELLKEALRQMPKLTVEFDPDSMLKVDPESTVQLDPETTTVFLDPESEIKVDPAATIKLDPDHHDLTVSGTVKVDPNSTVKLDTDKLSIDMPALPNIEKQPAQTKSGDIIKREVTVFSTVDHAKGTVVTGWEYANGGAKSPTRQFCYYRQGDTAIDFAANRQVIPAELKKVPQGQAAFNKCQWI